MPRAIAPHRLVSTLALPLLLITVAVLQYRWIDSAADVERERARRLLDREADSLVAAFDGEILTAFECFGAQRDPGGFRDAATPARWRAWQSRASEPGIVASVQEIDFETGEVETTGASGTTSAFDQDMAQTMAAFLGRDIPSLPVVMLGDTPALVMPSGAPRPEGETRPDSRRIVVVRFDSSVLKNRFLPALAAKHLDDETSAIVEGPDGDVWSRGTVRGPGVVRRPMFSVTFGPARRPPPPRRDSPSDRGAEERGPEMGNQQRFGLWELQLSPRAGSLDSLARKSRVRNLAISGTVLGVLAGAILLLVIASRRAEQMARQQLEFVAGITHELNTPLAAIRSAAENLAHGVVREEEKVRAYGDLILRQETRLAGMVHEALEFAGIASGQKRYRFQNVDLAEVVEEAIREVSGNATDSGVRIEKVLHRGDVRADRDSLRSAVNNLLSNAIKYGVAGGVVRVRCDAGRETVIEVEDDGAGVPDGELAHLFEAFYRGSSQRRARGTGLGLALVKETVSAHGGTVRAERNRPRGMRFIITLPAAGGTA